MKCSPEGKFARNHVKNCSVSLAVGDVNFQTTLKYLDKQRVNNIFFNQGVRLANNLDESEKIFKEIQESISEYGKNGFDEKLLLRCVIGGVRHTQNNSLVKKKR